MLELCRRTARSWWLVKKLESQVRDVSSIEGHESAKPNPALTRNEDGRDGDLAPGLGVVVRGKTAHSQRANATAIQVYGALAVVDDDDAPGAARLEGKHFLHKWNGATIADDNAADDLVGVKGLPACVVGHGIGEARVDHVVLDALECGEAVCEAALVTRIGATGTELESSHGAVVGCGAAPHVALGAVDEDGLKAAEVGARERREEGEVCKWPHMSNGSTEIDNIIHPHGTDHLVP